MAVEIEWNMAHSKKKQRNYFLPVQSSTSLVTRRRINTQKVLKIFRIKNKALLRATWCLLKNEKKVGKNEKKSCKPEHYKKSIKSGYKGSFRTFPGPIHR